MKKLFTISLLLTVALTASAAKEYTFNGANGSGSGDLTQASYWTPTTKTVPLKYDLLFTQPGELNASASKTFTGVAKIKTAGPLVFNLANATTFATIRGFVNDGLIMVSNGTQMVVTKAFDIANRASGSTVTYGKSRLVVTGAGTKLTTSGTGNLTTGRGVRNAVDIINGAQVSLYGLTIGSSSAASDFGEDSHSLKIGAGSTLTMAFSGTVADDSLVIGNAGYGNVMEVYGTFDQSSEYNDVTLAVKATSTNNELTVYNGGVFKLKGRLFLGSLGSYNRLTVKQGGTFSQVDNAMVYVGRNGSYNTFDYENPTYVPKLMIGADSASVGNLVRLHGDGSHTASGTLANCTFGTGTVNRLVLENFTFVSGANTAINATKAGNRMIFRNMDFTTQQATTWGADSDNSIYEFDNTKWKHVYSSDQHRTLIRSQNTTMRFENGSAANLANVVCVGDAAASDGGETLEVLSNSSLTFSSLYLHNSNNRMVISNATLNLNQDFANLTRTTDKYSGAVGAFSTNLVIRFEGDAPKLANTQAAAFAYSAGASSTIGGQVLEFAMPESPYAVAPFQAKSITFPKTAKIRLEFAGRASKYTKEYVLARATGADANDKITVADMEELSSELPGNCKLSLSVDQKQLSVKFISSVAIYAW